MPIILQFLIDIARQKNSMPLPLIPEKFGPRLPPERYCLTSNNYRVKDRKKQVYNESTCMHASASRFTKLLFYTQYACACREIHIQCMHFNSLQSFSRHFQNHKSHSLPHSVSLSPNKQPPLLPVLLPRSRLNSAVHYCRQSVLPPPL